MDFKPSKAMGQNFLADGNIAQKIVRLSGICKSHGVLEVGPGHGALTKHLAEAAGHVAAVELDSRLLPGLREALSGCGNVTVVQGDILKTNICELADRTLPEPCRHVCANLPYSITTPVITRLVESGVFTAITVMVQKEVALRMCASPGTSDYGAFTVYVNYHMQPEILFDVPPQCFDPRPKVTSSVVKMVLRTEHLLAGGEEKGFFRVVRAAFAQRRKTLVNALYAAYKNTHTKEEITAAAEICGLDANVRGERLSVEEFARLTRLLEKR